VQIALDSILRGKRVIHVSIGESIEKTKAWYDDILQLILQDHSVNRPHELIDMVARHRMIMTFKLKALAEAMSLQIWLSAVCHREDKRVSAAGVPAPCHEVDDLFDTVIVIRPEESKIRLNVIKNEGEVLATDAGLDLDPTTMMVKKS
jgi:catechol 2,3-dioxygenase-like lactoylglutathione lyase family enzyme